MTSDLLQHSGLTEAKAQELLREQGPNELPGRRRHQLGELLSSLLLEPMLLLLLACGAIYWLSGERADGALLFASAAFVIGLTLVQRLKSERALEALREMSSPRALVMREGQLKRIPARELVVGDLVRVMEGDRVPADAEIVLCSHLKVDESMLTGESLSVVKAGPGDSPNQTHGLESLSLFSGTLVVSGDGYAVVTQTGENTQVGKIGKSLQGARRDRTSLQREIDQMVRVFGFVGITFSIGIAVVYGWTRGHWVEGALAGLAAAMSLLPEEFPVVLTVFFALGAWRISRKKVLTRDVAAIEALGAISTLCVDKTGTLTRNQMELVKAWTPSLGWTDSSPIRAETRELLITAALACTPEPFDPMEKAISQVGNQASDGGFSRGLRWVRQYPISPGLLA